MGKGTHTAAAAAIEAFFTQRGVKPVSAGDGRYTVYLPIGDGAHEGGERLQLSLAATPRSAGILARVRAMRAVDREQYPQALTLCNEWNRRNPTPRAALAPRGDGATGECLLEDWLPAVHAPAPEQLALFVDAVVGGARRFWASPTITELARPAV